MEGQNDEAFKKMTCYDDKFLWKEPLSKIVKVDDEGRDILNSIVKTTLSPHVSRNAVSDFLESGRVTMIC